MTNSKVSKNMQNIGLSMLARSVCDVTFSQHTKPFSHLIAVPQIVNALEIIIKSKLIEIDPFCIFEDSPRLTKLDWEDSEVLLVLKTKRFIDLPKLVKEKLSINIDIEKYTELGKKRNMVTHIGLPVGEDLDYFVLENVFNFILPCLTSIAIDVDSFYDFLYEWDDVIFDGYLNEKLMEYNISIPEQLLNYND
jgi:hypothetical protein